MAATQPARAKGPEIRALQQGSVNPFTKRPYSQRYKLLLAAREKTPVYKQMDSIVATLDANQIVVLTGETGSGKSTQVPQFMLYWFGAKFLEDNAGTMIGFTQPRVVAARALSERLADELDCSLGREVGQRCGGEQEFEEGRTRLLVLTDGSLVRELMRDPKLKKYIGLIIDEAHMKTDQTELVLGNIKTLVAARPDFRVIIMSATLDAAFYQTYFDGAPIVEVPGRMHPVSKFYLKEHNGGGIEPERVIASQIMKLHVNQPIGDILVFVAGTKDINKVEKALKTAQQQVQMKGSVAPTQVYPLHGKLDREHQDLAINDPAPIDGDGTIGRKVIIATNIAETSLTIDGVVYVIDSMYVNVSVDDPQHGQSLLAKVPESKAEGTQKAGRAGRNRPGMVFRVCTELAHEEAMPKQPIPPIQAMSLSSTLCNLFIMKGNPITFDWPSSPANESIMRGLEELHRLDLLDTVSVGRMRLNERGLKIAVFPLEPHLAVLLIESPRFGCSSEILTIVSMVTAGNESKPWPRINDKSVEGGKERRAEAYFRDASGDHMTLLNLWEVWEQARNSNVQLGDFCQKHHLNFQFMRKAERLRKELLGKMQTKKIALNSLDIDDPQYDVKIRRALVSSYFTRCARRFGTTDTYRTFRDRFGAYYGRDTVNVTKTTPQNIKDRASEPKPHQDWIIYDNISHPTDSSEKPEKFQFVSYVDLDWLIQASPRFFDPASMRNSETKDEVVSAVARLSGLSAAYIRGREPLSFPSSSSKPTSSRK